MNFQESHDVYKVRYEAYCDQFNAWKCDGWWVLNTSLMSILVVAWIVIAMLVTCGPEIAAWPFITAVMLLYVVLCLRMREHMRRKPTFRQRPKWIDQRGNGCQVYESGEGS